MSNTSETSPLLRVFGAPLRYLQGPGAIHQLGAQVASLAPSAALISDRFVLDLVGDRVAASCKAAGVRLSTCEFSGDITPAEVQRLVGQLAQDKPGVVIAAGGGKGIDVGKAVAKVLGAHVVTVPTVASNDAPTSKIFVLYDEQHRLLSVEHMTHNPAAVVVDTDLIAAAPVKLLLAGIGDALSKKFEVERCAAAGGLNIYGGLGTQAALALADLSYRSVREHAESAIQAVQRGTPDVHLESLVEATVLLSGLCFENGGLSVSHAMTRGLSAIAGTATSLHGLQVAYGLLVQLTLEEREPTFMAELRGFYSRIGLPQDLGELGLARTATDEEIETISRLTMTAPHVRNFPTALSAERIALAIRSVEAERTR
ncbi:glycerol dehydrogenase [Hydrogenophaga sp.]|uniref:glycerol dehydrogenase n=1 Tax=Hydrogenophaga sp. TaxID=1904254 RepID=UPI002FC89FD5